VNLVLGTPNFIKKKFGIGYNLSVSGLDSYEREE
jgi:hypothetical protein